MSAEIDRDVRLALFELFVELERAPTRDEVARRAGCGATHVQASYERLHEGHAIVLHPDSRDVWMANPFSAVPTPFRVRVGARSWFANCIWDALGVCAALGGEGVVHTECPDCAERLSLSVSDYQVQGGGVAHFLVPAAHFWDDIGFT